MCSQKAQFLVTKTSIFVWTLHQNTDKKKNISKNITKIIEDGQSDHASLNRKNNYSKFVTDLNNFASQCNEAYQFTSDSPLHAINSVLNFIFDHVEKYFRNIL